MPAAGNIWTARSDEIEGGGDMKKMGFVMIAALAACVSTEAELERAKGICAAAGVTEGTEEYRLCLSDETAKMAERRENIGQALAYGLESYGEGRQEYARQSYYSRAYSRQSLHCTSNQNGNYVYTNCY